MKITFKDTKVMVEPSDGKKELYGGICLRAIDLRKIEDFTIQETKLAYRMTGKFTPLFHKSDCENDTDFENKCIEVIDKWFELK